VYLHTGRFRRFRHGGRPAAAEEALPDVVRVAGSAPGAGAAAERTHVGLLRVVRACRVNGGAAEMLPMASGPHGEANRQQRRVGWREERTMAAAWGRVWRLRGTTCRSNARVEARGDPVIAAGRGREASAQISMAATELGGRGQRLPSASRARGAGAWMWAHGGTEGG
jgi:hypothetical protein